MALARRTDTDIMPGHTCAVVFALCTGVAYALAVWAGPQILALFGVPFVADDAYLAEHGLKQIVSIAALRIPALLLLAVAVTLLPCRTALRALLSDRAWHAALLIAPTAGAALLLNSFEVWPWVWRWPGSPGLGYAASLVEFAHPTSVIVLGLVWGVINPFLEEVFFRLGMLQLLLRTGNPWLAIWTTAILYSAAHFGGGIPSEFWHVLHAGWLVAFGAFLAWVTVKRDGQIAFAVVIHATRNTVEQVMLIQFLRV